VKILLPLRNVIVTEHRTAILLEFGGPLIGDALSVRFIIIKNVSAFEFNDLCCIVGPSRALNVIGRAHSEVCDVIRVRRAQLLRERTFRQIWVRVGWADQGDTETVRERYLRLCDIAVEGADDPEHRRVTREGLNVFRTLARIMDAVHGIVDDRRDNCISGDKVALVRIDDGELDAVGGRHAIRRVTTRNREICSNLHD